MKNARQPEARRATLRTRFVAPHGDRLYSYVATPVGKIRVVSDGSALVELHLPGETVDDRLPDHYRRDDRALQPVAAEIAAYFDGDLTEFSVALAPSGTEFQRSVWNALCQIEYGTVATYGNVAVAIDRPKAPRAVGMANHVNPIAIIIPCHRVIGTNGKLTGYAGGLEMKQTLISHEASVRAGERPIWVGRS